MQKEVLAALVQVGGQFISKAIVMIGQPKLNREEHSARIAELEGPRFISMAERMDAMMQTAPAAQLPVVVAPTPPPPPTLVIKTEIPPPVENKATAVKTGCIPCSLGHFGAANGMLAEAMRFARKEGLGSGEVIDRVGEALDEFNALERKDMTPAMMQQLPEWEHELALKALDMSRKARHDLEALDSVEDLEKVAALVETTRKELGRAWFQAKFKTLTPENQQKVRDFYEAKKKEADDAPVERQGVGGSLPALAAPGV